MTAKFNNIGKKEIANNIKTNIGFTSKFIFKIIEDIIDTFTSELAVKKKINIKNFGSFTVYYKKQRQGRNPKTKEEFIINSRNTIKFKPSISLKQKINDL